VTVLFFSFEESLCISVSRIFVHFKIVLLLLRVPSGLQVSCPRQSRGECRYYSGVWYLCLPRLL